MYFGISNASVEMEADPEKLRGGSWHVQGRQADPRQVGHSPRDQQGANVIKILRQ